MSTFDRDMNAFNQWKAEVFTKTLFLDNYMKFRDRRVTDSINGIIEPLPTISLDEPRAGVSKLGLFAGSAPAKSTNPALEADQKILRK